MGHDTFASSTASISEFVGLEYMTQDHYAAFGIVVHLTSQLDATLDQIIVAMANAATQPTFYPLLTFLSAKDKRDYIVAMAKVAQWPPYAIKGMGGLMDRAKSASDLRNDIAHCLWKKGRRKGTIKPIVLSARGAIKVLGSGNNEREWTAAELIAEAKKIHQIGIDLRTFMLRYGLVPALPEIPPPTPSPMRNRRKGKTRQDE